MISKKFSQFWTSLFGFQIGDKVRRKYGKASWEIFAINEADWMNNKPRYYKLRRRIKRRSRFGVTFEGETITQYLFETDWDFKEWEKVEEPTKV